MLGPSTYHVYVRLNFFPLSEIKSNKLTDETGESPPVWNYHDLIKWNRWCLHVYLLLCECRHGDGSHCTS